MLAQPSHAVADRIKLENFAIKHFIIVSVT